MHADSGFKPIMKEAPGLDIHTEKYEGRSKKICCVMIIITLIIIVMTFNVLSITIFKLKQPEIKVNAQKLKNLGHGGSSNNINSKTLNTTIITIITINNPNYGSFENENTTAIMEYHGEVVVDIPIPQQIAPACE